MGSWEALANGGMKAWLSEHGATEAQVNSKVVDMIERAMLDGEVSVSETAAEQMIAFGKYVDDALKAVRDAEMKTNLVSKAIDDAARRARDVQDLLDQAEVAVDQVSIGDPAITDGLVAFERMLVAVRDTFGQPAMTDAVICAAIEAGSYGMWRSVMGPKHEGAPKPVRM